jgi:hypothetical protein
VVISDQQFAPRVASWHSSFLLGSILDGSFTYGRIVRADRRNDKGGMQSPMIAIAIFLIGIGLFAAGDYPDNTSPRSPAGSGGCWRKCTQATARRGSVR